jgi:8-oxo-dGTP diphosphatase
MTLTIDLVPHMDAGDRNAWSGDQNVRPLTELGRQQAEAIAKALSGDPIDALYASPALRCHQTLGPLAERLGLGTTTLPEFGEESWRSPDGWPEQPSASGLQGPLGGLYVAGHAAGRAMAGVERIRAERGGGRAVVCSHGHIIPNLIAYLVGAHGLTDVQHLKQRGQWYQVRFDGGGAEAELREVNGDFPR